MNDFQERMESGKLNAARDRARGLHTGKLAKGWNVKRPQEDNHVARVQAIAAEWRAIRRDIVNQFRAACLNSLNDQPDQWEILL